MGRAAARRLGSRGIRISESAAAITSSSRALSRTVLVSACVIDRPSSDCPADGANEILPRRGFSPTRPQQDEGIRIEPVLSLPDAAPTRPAATAPSRIQDIADAAARSLEELGHRVESGLLSFDPDVMCRSIAVIHAVDNAATFNWLLEELGRRPDPDELDPVTWDMLNEGLELTAVDHVSAIDDLHAQTRLATRVFASADVLLCPTLNVLPPPPGALSASRGSVDAFFDVEFASTGATSVANAAGWAAITLPLG